MAYLLSFVIAMSVLCGVLFGAFVTICFAIRREDKVGTLAGRAPSRACQSARHMTGWHWARWARL